MFPRRADAVNRPDPRRRARSSRALVGSTLRVAGGTVAVTAAAALLTLTCVLAGNTTAPRTPAGPGVVTGAAMSLAERGAAMSMWPTASNPLHPIRRRGVSRAVPAAGPAVQTGAGSAGLIPTDRSVARVSGPDTDTGTGADSSDSGAAPYRRGLAGSAVGQIVSASTSCTATVIPSRSGRIAVTAAHCVYVSAEEDQPEGEEPLPVGWIAGLRFVPGRDGDDAPHGQWPITRAWIDARYRDTADPLADIAFIALADHHDATAQHALGAEGVSFATTDASSTDADTSSVGVDLPMATSSAADPPEDAAWVADGLGYPALDPFDGTTLRRCHGHPTIQDGLFAMACAMNGGSSGGPWMPDFDPSTGVGTLTAVISYYSVPNPQDTVSGADHQVFATPLGPFAARLLEAADTAAARPDATSPQQASTSSPRPSPTTPLQDRDADLDVPAGPRAASAARATDRDDVAA